MQSCLRLWMTPPHDNVTAGVPSLDLNESWTQMSKEQRVEVLRRCGRLCRGQAPLEVFRLVRGPCNPCKTNFKAETIKS